MGRTIRKGTEDFNTINQLACIGHSNITENTFFTNGHETFSRIVYILGHKTNFDKFKNTQIMQSIFCTQVKLEINNKRETGKSTNMKKLSNTINQRTKRKLQGEFENIWR